MDRGANAAGGESERAAKSQGEDGTPQVHGSSRLNFFRHHERLAIPPVAIAQQAVRFLIAHHLLGRRIEIEGTTEEVRHIGQVHKG